MNEKSLKLLEQYEIELLGSRRGRGAYICETNLGTKLFTEYHGSEKKLKFTNLLLDQMAEKGFRYPDKVMENKEGVCLCKDRDEQGCILKDWYEGRECDTRNSKDVLAAVVNLAQVHKLMIWKSEEGALYQETDLRTIWKRHNRELKKIFEFIRKRKQKNAFECLFLNLYNEFAVQAQNALRKLEESSYEELFHRSLEMGQLCHGNYNQHNIYFLGKKQMFTANFEKCGYDIQINDLHQFVRKIMEKQEWNPETGRQMLEAYDQEKPMTEQEREYLKIRLCYPEKFWKVANQYYNCRKSCISGKNAEKLEKLAMQEKKRKAFLDGL